MTFHFGLAPVLTLDATLLGPRVTTAEDFGPNTAPRLECGGRRRGVWPFDGGPLPLAGVSPKKALAEDDRGLDHQGRLVKVGRQRLRRKVKSPVGEIV